MPVVAVPLLGCSPPDGNFGCRYGCHDGCPSHNPNLGIMPGDWSLAARGGVPVGCRKGCLGRLGRPRWFDKSIKKNQTRASDMTSAQANACADCH
jgi:hypothetical protein